MSMVTIELELPQDWDRFRIPPTLKSRLSDLLDQQDRDGKLTKSECQEAQALTELTDMLSHLKLRAERIDSRRFED